MARTSNPYTLEERNIVLKWLQLYPDNLLQGFTRAVEELGNNRNVPALRVKYYSTWKHEEDFRAVTTGSREGFTHNVKNTKSVDGEFPEDRALNKVEWLMKQFLDLSKDDRDKIFNFFISVGSIETKTTVINKAKSVKIK